MTDDRFNFEDEDPKAHSEFYIALTKTIVVSIEADSPEEAAGIAVAGGSGYAGEWARAEIEGEPLEGQPLPNSAVIIHTRIGVVDEGIDGRDEYILLTRKDYDLTPRQAVSYLLPKVYRRSSHPGAYFCTSVRAMQSQFQLNAVVCIIEHRYDI